MKEQHFYSSEEVVENDLIIFYLMQSLDNLNSVKHGEYMQAR